MIILIPLEKTIHWLTQPH